MPPDPADRKITADELLDINFGNAREYEVADGIVISALDFTIAHADVFARD